jgi:hypothetical protein
MLAMRLLRGFLYLPGRKNQNSTENAAESQDSSEVQVVIPWYLVMPEIISLVIYIYTHGTPQKPLRKPNTRGYGQRQQTV